MNFDVVYICKIEERTLIKPLVIDFISDEEIIMVIDILVDEFGYVAQTNLNIEETKGNWFGVLEKTLQAIRGMEFNSLSNIEDEEIGIHYYTENDYLSDSESEYYKGVVKIIFFIDY